MILDISWVYGVVSAVIEYWYQHTFSYVAGNWQAYFLLGFCVSLALLGTIFQTRYGFVPAYLRT